MLNVITVQLSWAEDRHVKHIMKKKKDSLTLSPSDLNQ